MDRRLLYVFALLEAGMSGLATLGGLLFMGLSPLYIGSGLAVVVLYVAAGQAASRGRRWGLLTLIICESVRLIGFALSGLIGMLPWVELTLTGSSLTDGFILPSIVAVMAAVQLVNRPAATIPGAPAADTVPADTVSADTVSAETLSIQTASLDTVAMETVSP